MNNVIKEKLSLLKELPGCYLMKNKDNQVIYVGKAKKLVNRVSSYFIQKHTGKTAKLVSEIVDFDYIVTGSEKEAFLLEINLIHQYNPKYNILLKDSRVYPYIELHNTTHPYLSIARNVNNKNNKYFGPYSDSSSAYQTINLLNRIYPLRKCNSIPSKPCLYYHINQCLGPCINKVNKEDYKSIVDSIISFLNGNNRDVKNSIKEKMLKASDELNFELANEYKKILESIDHISSKQVIQISSKDNFDVFAYHIKDGYISISTLVYRDGVLRLKNNQVLEYYSDEIVAFTDYIIQYYQYNVVPSEIIVPNLIDIESLAELLETKVITPTKGLKYELLSRAGLNSIESMNEKYLISKVKDDIANQVKLDLENICQKDNINTIELIDNSHFNGADPVSAVVVFSNMVPNKKMYRKYRINSQNTKDDLNSMKEVLYRRYLRKINEGDKFSDLLIVDGGMNQLEAALEVLQELKIDSSTMRAIGLEKDDKHNTNAIVLETGELIEIKDNKNLYFFLAKMQDEVHNFVIRYHRDKRSTRMVKSVLDDIKGLGEKRKNKLIEVYGDIDTIKKLSVSELSIYLPKNVAEEVYNKFNQ